MKLRYTKTCTLPQDLIPLLRSRGLLITNEQKTINYLAHIGYFRFSAYLYPLLQEPKTNHHYKDGATFDMAFDIYRFDRKLRTLFFNEIEKIEVAVRSAMSNYISESLGDVFWMTNAKYFYNQSLFTKTLLLVQSYEAHLLPYLHHQISAVHGVAKQYVHAKIDVIVGRIFSHRHSRYGLPHHVASRTPLDNITQHFKRLSNRLSNFYS